MKKVLIVLLIMIFIYCVGGIVYCLKVKDDVEQKELVLNIRDF